MLYVNIESKKKRLVLRFHCATTPRLHHPCFPPQKATKNWKQLKAESTKRTKASNIFKHRSASFPNRAMAKSSFSPFVAAIRLKYMPQQEVYRGCEIKPSRSIYTEQKKISLMWIHLVCLLMFIVCSQLGFFVIWLFVLDTMCDSDQKFLSKNSLATLAEHRSLSTHLPVQPLLALQVLLEIQIFGW